MRIILSSIFLSVLLGTATATSEDHPGQEEQASSNLRALSDVTTKIVGGKPSAPGEFPYYGKFISSTSSALVGLAGDAGLSLRHKAEH